MGCNPTVHHWMALPKRPIQTSGRAVSAGGTGKTIAEMQTASTFLEAAWDFVGETANGTEDIRWINEGKDYPQQAGTSSIALRVVGSRPLAGGRVARQGAGAIRSADRECDVVLERGRGQGSCFR
jgi:hypothetical protein